MKAEIIFISGTDQVKINGKRCIGQDGIRELVSEIAELESQLKEEREKVKMLQQLLASTENQNKHLSRKILTQNPK